MVLPSTFRYPAFICKFATGKTPETACLFLRSYLMVKVPNLLVALLSADITEDTYALTGTSAGPPTSRDRSTHPFPVAVFPDVTF